MVAVTSMRGILFLAFLLVCLIMNVCEADMSSDSFDRDARAPKAKFIRFGRAGQKFIRFGRSGPGAQEPLNDDQLAYWLSQQGY